MKKLPLLALLAILLCACSITSTLNEKTGTTDVERLDTIAGVYLLNAVKDGRVEDAAAFSQARQPLQARMLEQAEPAAEE
jgi:hypothetical protein